MPAKQVGPQGTIAPRPREKPGSQPTKRSGSPAASARARPTITKKALKPRPVPVATATPADPRLNQDVRDVVTDFALDSVRDVCSLRRVSRTWRLAADNRLRMLVGAAVPSVLPWAPGGQHEPEDENAGPRRPARLTIDLEDPALDDLRLRFTFDRGDVIVRAVLVAFALDGAKDAVAEAGWCGARPVELKGVYFAAPQLLKCTLTDADADTFVLKRPACAQAAFRCLEGNAPSISDMSVGNMRKALAKGVWATPVRSLELGYDQLGSAAIGLLDELAPGLTTLGFGTGSMTVPESLHRALAKCSNLTRLNMSFSQIESIASDGGDEFDDDPLVRLFDAIIESGAPITHLEIEGLGKPCALAGLLNGLRTVRRLSVNPVGRTTDFIAQSLPHAMPAAVMDRIELFEMNHGSTPPGIATSGYTSVQRVGLSVSELPDGRWWEPDQGPREKLHTLYIKRDRALPLNTNFAQLFPNLRVLNIDNWQSVTRLDNAVPGLPPLLESLTVGSAVGFDAWLKESIELAGGLPHLRAVRLKNVDSAEGMLGCTGALTSIGVEETFHSPGPTQFAAELIAAHAATLEALAVPDLRCLNTPVRFPRLRTLRSTARENVTPAGQAAVLAGCPRLHEFHAAGLKYEGVDGGAWTGRGVYLIATFAVKMVRQSFAFIHIVNDTSSS